MIILGLIDSKPSAAAIMVDGRIVSAIAEERLSRMKMANGMPRQAITRVLADAGLAPADVDLVAVAQNTKMFEPEPLPWDGWFEDRTNGKKHLFDQVGSTLAPLVGRSPVAWRAHHALKSLLAADRRVRLPRLLRDVYGITAPVQFFDHHYCHATSAYYPSGFERALVVTLDGGGDGRSGSVYAAENGVLRPLAGVSSFNSLGNFYSYVTVLCGFKAEKHEGKVTGLAALGEPLYAGILRRFVRYDPPGQVRYVVPMYHHSAVQRLAQALPPDLDRAALAASAQLVLEEIGTAFVRYWLRRTGLRNVAVAGGVFSNVKFNQRVHELEEVDHIFIQPAMDDSGLAIGAAYAAARSAARRPDDLVGALPNVYLGPTYTEQEVERAALSCGYPAEFEARIHERVARLLAEGYVVARATGRMEYGPRALGHRSILYQTTDPSVNDWLNERLDRTEFMPFAPATLTEYADECFHGLAGAKDPARFMTMTFDCTPRMRATSPGVVHVDGTARPQLVDPETANDFYRILVEYHRLTGIPSLINTSFNMHEEPIVCTPQDAVRSFKQGKLDFLALGNWLIRNPAPVPHPGVQATVSSKP